MLALNLASGAAALAGGIGLFLLGMWLMTDGLKLAAGDALRAVLARGTGTPLRGLFAGVGLTATVQSSSAVTVATVGFVNAGLLTLGQAVWVIYGANIGTTMTGWIVAVTGVEVRLDAWALPLIAFGMLLRVSGPASRRAAWGQALAGFAVFLMGIQVLKSNFSVLAGQIDLSQLPAAGWRATTVFFMVGTLLTVLIQSSSATTAIAITAAAAGVVPVNHAALVIVGADLGTSSTAAIAAAGATANARRAAVSHVLFNLVTTLFAVASLPWLLRGADMALSAAGLSQRPAMTLALFSTVFNVIGVVLMWPITGRMVRFLEGRFGSRDADLARPRYLDATIREVPELALRGAVLELQRLGRETLRLAADSIADPRQSKVALERRASAMDTLGSHIQHHVARMPRAGMTAAVAESLGQLLRGLQHYEEVRDLATAGGPIGALAEDLRSRRRQLDAAADAALAAADTAAPTYSASGLLEAASLADRLYEALKRMLLAAAAAGRLPIAAMDSHMQDIARVHRMVERGLKAAQRLAPLRDDRPGAPPGTTPARTDLDQRAAPDTALA